MHISQIIPKAIELDRILYTSTSVSSYNKPVGLIVHPADHKTDEVSLIQMVQNYVQHETSHTFRPSLAHRIDRDTSGIVVSCKTKKSLMSLTAQFRSRTVQKTYLAFCHGVPEQEKGTVEDSILRVDEDRTNKPKVIIDAK